MKAVSEYSLLIEFNFSHQSTTIFLWCRAFWGASTALTWCRWKKLRLISTLKLVFWILRTMTGLNIPFGATGNHPEDLFPQLWQFQIFLHSDCGICFGCCFCHEHKWSKYIWSDVDRVPAWLEKSLPKASGLRNLTSLMFWQGQVKEKEQCGTIQASQKHF